MSSKWIADRMQLFDASGIRKVFDLGAKLKNPINLSIGQPDFDPPENVKDACVEAIRNRKNGYSVTQGAAVLLNKVSERVKQEYGHADREAFVTSGTSGGLMLVLMSVVNPGDEVVIFDPYFVMYEALVKAIGGVPVFVDTYPDFKIDLNRVAEAITPRTKIILFNSPANPTGAVVDEATVRGLAELAAAKDVLLLSDEIYRSFCYDGEFVSPAKYNDRTLVIDGFSKSHGAPGWRVGFAHGPKELIQEMLKLQQYSFVCAPHPMQWACAVALDVDMTPQMEAYRRKRNMIVEGLAGFYELSAPGGAFYAFPKLPAGMSGDEFLRRAIDEYQLLIIPGSVFSRKDTHFRISFAASDEMIARGVEALRKLAKG